MKMTMPHSSARNRSRFLTILTLASLVCLSAQAAWVRWDTAAGGNGHWYKAVLASRITPRIASDLAQQDGGYLATITSAEENAFVFSLVNSPSFFIAEGWGPALGGRQEADAPEPDGGWYWVTGEAWDYVNWWGDNPNDGYGQFEEDSLQFYSHIQNTPAPTWNDLGFDEPACSGYVVERDDEPPPRAEWVRWEASSGGNGHLYKAVLANGITPRIASDLARQEGGYLATITSAEENAFVFGLVNFPEFFYGNGSPNGGGPILGGFMDQDAPDLTCCWYWVTGEPWSYSNWLFGQPDSRDDGWGWPDSMHFFSGTRNVPAPTWDDAGFEDTNRGGYVVEKDDEFGPLSYVNTSLVPKGRWSPTNGLAVAGVRASGSRALVRLGSSEVVLLDISNSAAPVALGAWSTFLPTSDAILVGSLAYVTSWEAYFLSTVEIVDFADPANPVLRAYYDTPGYAQAVAVEGNVAYVADADGGLLTLDVSDPAQPRRLGGYEPKGSVRHVEVSGGHAFIDAGNGLFMLNVSDPANPRRVGLYQTPSPVSCLSAYGTKLYVGEETGDLRILDVGTPAHIQLSETYTGWLNPAQGMACSGRILPVARGSFGLQVLDVSDPAKPTWLTCEGTKPAQEVALMGSYVLVASREMGLIVYELQQSLHPPLKPPIISDGTATLTWPPADGVRIQKTTNLLNRVWQDIPESQGASTLTLPITDPPAFFRLVKGPQLPPGLVAWWPGDGSPQDILGGHDAFLRGNATFADGRVGQAFSLDGDGDFVEVADAPGLNFGADDFTVAAWVKLNSLNQEMIIIEKYVARSGSANGWGLCSVGGSVLQFYLEDSTRYEHLNTISLPVRTNEWFFLAARRAGQDATVFHEGVPVSSWSLSASIDVSSTSTLKMGHRGNPNDTPGSTDDRQLFLNGALDEVMLFNRALTAAEIKAIYDAGSAGKIKPSH
jgi:hypothetical protein